MCVVMPKNRPRSASPKKSLNHSNHQKNTENAHKKQDKKYNKNQANQCWFFKVYCKLFGVKVEKKDKKTKY